MKVMIRILMFLILPFAVSAKDLGNFGKVWNVKEKNPVETLQNDTALQKKILRKAKASYPKHPRTFPEATETITYELDPTYTIKQDIVVGGKIIKQKGETINPLEHVNANIALIFVDGHKQIAWAKAQLKELSSYNEIKIISVAGNIYDLQKQHPEIKLYFDQNGFYTKHFAVKVTPTLIKTAGTVYEVTEAAL